MHQPTKSKINCQVTKAPYATSVRTPMLKLFYLKVQRKECSLDSLIKWLM